MPRPAEIPSERSLPLVCPTCQTPEFDPAELAPVP